MAQASDVKTEDCVTFIKLPGAKNIALWKYFGFKSKDGKNIWNEGKERPTVYCVISGCSKPSMQYYGNTTNIVRHLQVLHPKENAAYLGLGMSSNTSPLAKFIKKNTRSLTDQRAKKVTGLIVNVIIKDLRPVNIVDGAGFVDLIHDAYPEYPLASNHYYTDRINDVYAVEATKLQELLQEVDSVAVTTDLWTSMAHHAYLGITAHFITRAGSLQTRLLDCIEMAADQHTAEDIAELLTERFTYWGLDNKVFAAVSDNGQNMVKALRDIMHIPVIIIFGCFAHTVNLAVEKGLKCSRVSPLLARARHVVEHFTRSSKATYLLRAAQVAAGKSESEVLELVRDVPTRWTSVYDMIKRLILLQDAVHTVLANSDKRHVRELDLSAESLFQLRELNTVLEPLCSAMQGMGGEEYSAVSVLTPLLHKLLTKGLTSSDSDTPVVFDFKKAASEDLAGRYSLAGQKEFFAACSFLDPQFKEFRFVKDLQLRSQHKQLAIDFLKTSSPGSVAVTLPRDQTAESDNEPPTKKFKGNEILRAYLTESDDEDDDSNAATATPTEMLQLEIERYESNKRISPTTQPIVFWTSAKTPELVAKIPFLHKNV